MDLSFNSSVSGLRAAVTRVDNTAHSIANANTDGFKSQRLIQSEGVKDTVSISAAGYNAQDISRDMTDLMSDKHTYGANLKMISMKNNMIGETIDLVR
jgi:flagellar hook protein FlgE